MHGLMPLKFHPSIVVHMILTIAQKGCNLMDGEKKIIEIGISQCQIAEFIAINRVVPETERLKSKAI